MIGNQEEVSVFRVTIIHVYEEALFYLASSRLTIVVTTDCSKENQCIWDRQFGEIIYGYSQTFWASQGSIRVPNIISHFKTERGTTLETLEQARASSCNDGDTSSLLIHTFHSFNFFEI